MMFTILQKMRKQSAKPRKLKLKNKLLLRKLPLRKALQKQVLMVILRQLTHRKIVHLNHQMITTIRMQKQVAPLLRAVILMLPIIITTLMMLMIITIINTHRAYEDFILLLLIGDIMIRFILTLIFTTTLQVATELAFTWDIIFGVHPTQL